LIKNIKNLVKIIQKPFNLKTSMLSEINDGKRMPAAKEKTVWIKKP
jgi:pimeloyl-CoA synthetase